MPKKTTPKSAHKTERIAFRVTKKQLKYLRELSRYSEMSVSEWCRDVCTSMLKDSVKDVRGIEQGLWE